MWFVAVLLQQVSTTICIQSLLILTVFALAADSWPQVLEDSNARKDWDWTHEYDLHGMTSAMLEALAPTAKFTAVIN